MHSDNPDASRPQLTWPKIDPLPTSVPYTKGHAHVYLNNIRQVTFMLWLMNVIVLREPVVITFFPLKKKKFEFKDHLE